MSGGGVGRAAGAGEAGCVQEAVNVAECEGPMRGKCGVPSMGLNLGPSQNRYDGPSPKRFAIFLRGLCGQPAAGPHNWRCWQSEGPISLCYLGMH